MHEDDLATLIVAPMGQPPPLHQVHLTWRTAKGATGSALLSETTLVGSSPAAGLIIDDPTISRVHAELSFREDGLWIRDLGSRNGTFVQGVKVESAQLAEGAKLRLGAVSLTTQIATVPVQEAAWPDAHFGRVLGASHSMRSLFARLDRASKSEATALVLGETGTGKELVAESIHQASSRRGKPFVIVDCGALHANLLESELFGHVRGAFTGAMSDRMGAFEAASGGTLFLDEVGEIPLEVQPKLLRVIEARTTRRVGENRARPVDVRIVAATHRDLAKMVATGTFREDLYFRLAVLVVRVPPLRDHAEDIPLYVDAFRGGAELRQPQVVQELMARRWSGNVRELRNYVERASAFGVDDTELQPRALESSLDLATGEEHFELPIGEARSLYVEAFEKRYLTAVLRRAQQNVAQAARLAGLDRTHLHRLLAKHGIERLR